MKDWWLTEYPKILEAQIQAALFHAVNSHLFIHLLPVDFVDNSLALPNHLYPTRNKNTKQNQQGESE